MQRLQISDALRREAAQYGWDLIRYVGELDGLPVFRLSFKGAPKGAKLGYPNLYFQLSDGSIEELSYTDMLRVIKSSFYQRGGKVME